jgi:hypothetical protein
MWFSFQRSDDTISGWVSPDNPSTVPVVEIQQADGSVFEFETNIFREDVRDAGIHHSGEVGFVINSQTIPGIDVDKIEIRDKHTSILLYRPPNKSMHLPMRVARFEMQAMPQAQMEAVWDSRFQLYYNVMERYPLDTAFGILNSDSSKSISLTGRFSLFRYEHLLRAADYKIIALLRDPIEELAERLLFVRYATATNNADKFRHYLTGLDGLALVARRLDLSEPATINEAFAYLPDKQRNELANPLTRALGCNVNEDPTSAHIEFALTRLSALDLVGTRSNFDKYKGALAKLLGTDILGERQPVTISEATKLAAHLKKSPIVQSLTALDVKLYNYVETAIKRAVEPQESGLDERTISELVESTHMPAFRQSDARTVR